MGLIRKTLRVATYGGVAARSKKQRTQAQILAAVQGKSEAEIAAAGARVRNREPAEASAG